MTKKLSQPQIIDYNNIKRKLKNNVLEKDHIKQYSWKNEKNITINDLHEILTKKSKEMKKKGFTGQYQIEVVTPQGPRTGYLTEIGKPADIWDPNEYDSDIIENANETSKLQKWYNDGNAKITDFNVWFMYKPNAGGCDGEFNDCIWNCIYNSYGGNLPINSRTSEPIFKMPYKLKKYLGIDRKAKVNTEEHIDRIEQKLKRGINIEGDVIRHQKVQSKNPINLILKSGHYELKKENDNKVTGISYKEKKPLFYKFNKETKKYDCYDGKHFELETEDFYKKRNNPISDEHCMLSCFKGKNYTLESAYKEFVEQADKLKDITHGKINLYKTGRITKTAIKLFYDTIKSMPNCDPITQSEAQWILGCNRAGHAFVENGYKGEAHKIDMVSMYPSIMNSTITLPFKKGEFKTITDEDIKEYFRYGIYRAEITNYDYKLFRHNKNNYYTHYDMNLARKHKFTINLIQDGQPNFLYYAPECNIRALELFRPFITMLYDIKSKHKDVFYSKKILNVLWGALSERRVDKYVWFDPKDTSKEFILDYEHEIINISTHISGKIKIDCAHSDKQFVTDFARFSPFITARGRQLISDIIATDKDNVVRVVTDGIISKTKLDIKYGTDMGMMKYEGYSDNVEIVHLYKVIAEFK